MNNCAMTLAAVLLACAVNVPCGQSQIVSKEPATTSASAPAPNAGLQLPKEVLEAKFRLVLSCEGIKSPLKYWVDPSADEVKGDGKIGENERSKEELQGGRWLADRWLPLILDEAWSANRQGLLTLEIRPMAGQNVYRLYAGDAAAAVYAVQHLVPPQLQKEWLDAIYSLDKSPQEPKLKQITEDEAGKVTQGLTAVNVETEEAKAAALEGMRVYNERRPQFLRLLSTSFLRYPRMQEPPKTLYQRGTAWLMAIDGADRMYRKEIYLMLQKDKEGMWRCTDIRGGEYFKGE